MATRTDTIEARDLSGLVREVVSLSCEPGRIHLYSRPDVAAELANRLAALGLKTVLLRQSICG